MATTRGNLDTIDQTQVRLLSGGSFATKLITTDASTRTAGNLLMTDSHGNAVDAGIAIASSGGGAISVNGTATVQVNGVDVSFDNIVLVNGA